MIFTVSCIMRQILASLLFDTLEESPPIDTTVPLNYHLIFRSLTAINTQPWPLNTQVYGWRYLPDMGDTPPLRAGDHSPLMQQTFI